MGDGFPMGPRNRYGLIDCACEVGWTHPYSPKPIPYTLYSCFIKKKFIVFYIILGKVLNPF